MLPWILRLSLLVIGCSSCLADGENSAAFRKGCPLLRITSADDNGATATNDRVEILLLPFPLTSRFCLKVDGLGDEQTIRYANRRDREPVVKSTLLWYDERRVEYARFIA